MSITVLLPAYNAELYLAKAMDSILAQTWMDFELLVMNDGSTDRTLEIVQGFASRDARVRVVSHANVGLATTLNRGFALARGEWIVMMNADDEMLHDRIEMQMAFIAMHPELAVASAWVIHIDADGREIARDNSRLTTHEAVEKLMAANEVIAFSHPAAILRRDAVLAVGGYRPQFRHTEDADLWNRMLEQGYKILVQPEFLLRYRIHEASVTVSKTKVCWQELRWCKDCMLRRRRGEAELTYAEFADFRKTLPLHTRLNQNRKDFAKVFYKTATFHYARRRYLAAVGNSLLAVALRPSVMLSQITTKLLVQRRSETSRTESKGSALPHA